MMRFIYLYFIFFAILVPAQQSTNRFEQEEYNSDVMEDAKPEEALPDVAASSPGDPADPTPIDDYLPLLVIAGIGLIAWKVRKRGVTL
ncbi:hypothetical protein [Kaistella pullorum]|uniref:Uncharacterized protein n=1 Tax=Kaistella pullorum TaxID=2763074 RepID=A0ABR8WPE5_9FLAO|nr:hypothetical protein [Kaistella pullorum]MBD8018763.1 hypothetical protein [Kaistella pullorum]